MSRRALAIGREVDADYVVLGQIDEMSMKRFRAHRAHRRLSQLSGTDHGAAISL